METIALALERAFDVNITIKDRDPEKNDILRRLHYRIEQYR